MISILHATEQWSVFWCWITLYDLMAKLSGKTIDIIFHNARAWYENELTSLLGLFGTDIAVFVIIDDAGQLILSMLSRIQ